MEAFVSRKRRKLSADQFPSVDDASTDDSTDFKLTLLASVHPDRGQDILLDYLLAYDGSVDQASAALSGTSQQKEDPCRKRTVAVGYQSSLSHFATSASKQDSKSSGVTRPVTKKGKTLHLYSPQDIETHTPCSIRHNFLPPAEADALLEELLAEASTFRKDKFQLFERVVESPHTSRFYVNSLEDVEEQKMNYYYNGNPLQDVSPALPAMLGASDKVQKAVNEDVERRIRDFHIGGKKLKFQSDEEWKPTVSLVNCYDGGKESVGWHSDQLAHLGPRSIIGSLSLGVAREFRVRRIVPPGPDSSSRGDIQGQIAIHLPHNSLLVMHAEMQEEWKHAITPSQAIDPHPLAENKRLNITYRCFRPYLNPKFTPRCKCGVPAILRCVQKREVTRGRYMWQCDGSYRPGEKGCSFFTWAEFDEDGKPPWVAGYKGNANGPITPGIPNVDAEDQEPCLDEGQ